MSRLRSISDLQRDASGVSLLEFAFVLPILLTLGLYGVEVARLAITRTEVSQIALSLADNASRLGQTDNSGVAPTVKENDLDAIIDGALVQGKGIDLEEQGRIIVSSLEKDEYTGRQYIHWQRCRGELSVNSAYGDDDEHNGMSGPPLLGMGSGAHKAQAQLNSAVMFVEITYEYDPLFENPFGSGERTIRQEAAFLIRDDRNLSPGITGSGSRSTCG